MASKATELTNQLIEYENSKKANQNYNSTPTKNYNVGERIISTPISVFNQIIKGASKGLEGVYDFAANLVGGAAGLFGNKDLQEDISNHTKFNWTDWWYNQTSMVDTDEKAYRSDFFDGVFQSIGQMLPSIALGAATGGTSTAAQAVSLGTFGVGAAGNATEQALNEGATSNEALGYGLLSGIKEVGTEIIGGKVGKLLGSSGKVFGVVGKGATNTATRTTGKELVKAFAKDAIEEGAEEALGDLIEPIIQMVYKDGTYVDLFEENGGIQGLLEDFAAGALTSGIMGGANTSINISRVGYQNYKLMQDIRIIDNLQKQAKKAYFKGDNALGDTLLEQRNQLIDSMQPDVMDAIKYYQERGKRRKTKTSNEILEAINTRNKIRTSSDVVGVGLMQDFNNVDITNENYSYYDPNNNTIYLRENQLNDIEKTKNNLIHEYTHSVSNENLINTITNNISEETYQRYYNEYVERYANAIRNSSEYKSLLEQGMNINDAFNQVAEPYIREEIAADELGKYFSNINDFKEAIKGANKKGFSKLLNNIKALYRNKNKPKGYSEIIKILQNNINKINKTNATKEFNNKVNETINKAYEENNIDLESPKYKLEDLQPQQRELFIDNDTIKQSLNSEKTIKINNGDIINLMFPSSNSTNRVLKNGYINAITTKTDAYAYKNRNGEIVKLNSNDSWLLMGFTQEQYNKVRNVNSETALQAQAGNSIVVPVLENMIDNLNLNTTTPIKLEEYFAGIGAIRQALINKGYQVESTGVVENNKNAIASYNALYNTNETTKSIIDYANEVKSHNVDLLVHGSPCQSNSLLNNSELKGMAKGSNTPSSLLWESVKAIKKVKPKIVIWENVENILKNSEIKATFNEYLKEMEDLGYTNSTKVLNALDYGVPQSRNRVFTVSTLDGSEYVFPNKKIKPQKFLDFLDDKKGNNITKIKTNEDIRYKLDDVNESLQIPNIVHDLTKKEKLAFKKELSGFNINWANAQAGLEKTLSNKIFEIYKEKNISQVEALEMARVVVQNVRNAKNIAQFVYEDGIYDTNGNKIIEGFGSIMNKLSKEEREDFELYLYHNLNIDRMTIEERIGKPLKEKLEKLETTLKENQTKLKEINKKLRELNVNQKAKEKAKVLKEIETLNKEIETLTKRLNYNNSLKRQTNEVKKRIRSLTKQIDTRNEKLKKLNDSLPDLDKAITEETNSKTPEIAKLTTERNNLNETINTTKDDIHSIKKSIKKAKNKPLFSEEKVLDNDGKETNEYVYGEKYSREEIQKILSKNSEYIEKFPKYAEETYKLMNYILDINIDSKRIGELDAETMRSWYPHYVPAFRAEKLQSTSGASNIGLVSVKAMQKAKGGSLPLAALDINIRRYLLQNYKANAFNAIGEILSYNQEVVVENNNTQENSEIESYEENINQENLKTQKTNGKNTYTFSYLINGERNSIELEANTYVGLEDLQRRFEAIDEVKDPLSKALSFAMKGYKGFITEYNPFFMIRNFSRDIQDAFIYTKYGTRRYIKNLTKSIKLIGRNNTQWKLYQQYGGLAGSVFETEKSIISSSYKNKKQNKISFAYWNRIVEQIPRFAEFLSSIEAQTETGEIVDYNRAIYDAQEVTINFGRHGASKVAKYLNRNIIPFFNATIQGGTHIGRAITSYNSVKSVAYLMFKAVLLGLVPAILNNMIYSDDDDYQNLSNYNKDNFYLIKIGDEFIKIPRGRLVAMIGGFYNQDNKTIADNIGSIWDTLSPVPNLRHIGSPITDIKTNTTWYGGEIVSSAYDNVRPKNQYDSDTSWFAKQIGKMLNYSPLKIDYLLEQYTGVIGDFVLPITSDSGWSSGTFTSSFKNQFIIDPTTQNSSSSKFYDLRQELNYQSNEGSLQAKAQLKYINKIKTYIDDIYNNIDEIEQDSSINNKEKQTQISILRGSINVLYNQAIKTSKEIRKELDKEYIDEENYENVYYYSVAKVIGAENTIHLIGEDVEEKANSLNELGISYDLYLQYYLDTKGANKDYKEEYIQHMPLSRIEKYMLYLISGYSIPDDYKNRLRIEIKNSNIDKEYKEKLLNKLS